MQTVFETIIVGGKIAGPLLIAKGPNHNLINPHIHRCRIYSRTLSSSPRLVEIIRRMLIAGTDIPLIDPEAFTGFLHKIQA